MKVIFNNIIPVKGFAAINLFGVLFVRNGFAVTDRMLNHERIHTAQMREMLYVFFYIWYVIEWVFRVLGTLRSFARIRGDVAYHNISFEREAFKREMNVNYLKKRKLFAWLKYLK